MCLINVLYNTRGAEAKHDKSHYVDMVISLPLPAYLEGN